MNKTIIFLIILYPFLLVLPLFNIAFNSKSFFLGIPISLLWMILCMTYLLIVAITAYNLSFKKTAKKIDEELEA